MVVNSSANSPQITDKKYKLWRLLQSIGTCLEVSLPWDVPKYSIAVYADDNFNLLEHIISLERRLLIVFCINIIRLCNLVEMLQPLSLHLCLLLLVITYQFVAVEASTISAMRLQSTSSKHFLLPWRPFRPFGGEQASTQKHTPSVLINILVSWFLLVDD